MHSNALDLIAETLARIPDRPDRPLQVLDVGALDVNGTPRLLVEARGWRYTGVDVQAGPNVDLLTFDDRLYDVPAGFYDVVLCANMLHNCRWPWVLVRAMAERLRIGGALVVVAPWDYERLKGYPRDALRFLPDGIEALFDWAALLTDYDIQLRGIDVLGTARRGHT